jgi:chromosome partitioning protein
LPTVLVFRLPDVWIANHPAIEAFQWLAMPVLSGSNGWQLKCLDVSADTLEGKGHSMRRIALVSLKGGVGKTASATALAVGLAQRGRRTLLIDADQQANATWTILGGQGSAPPTLASVLTKQVSAVDAIRETSTPGLDLLPADATLGGVNVELAQVVGRDTRLRSALASIEGRYDFVLIDTGPQLTTVLVNVLVYVDEVIAPVDAGVYAMLGLVQLEEAIVEVREAYGNDALRLAGLLLTKVSRNNVARDVEAELRTRFDKLVYKAVVPLSAKIEEAHSRGTTVLTHAPKSTGALAYDQFVEEVINGGRTQKRGRSKIVGDSGAGAVDAA